MIKSFLGFIPLLILGLVIFLLTTNCSARIDRYSSSLVKPINDCHIVQHSMGETCVPNHPHRVVTTLHPILGTALTLGVKPIASTATINTEDLFPKYLQNQIDGMEIIGTHTAPSMEKILMLKPDLILLWQHKKSAYPLLSQITPTIVVPWSGSALWQEQFKVVSKALSKEQEAQQAWKHFYQRVNVLKQTLSTRYQGKEFSIVGASSQSFLIHAKNSFSGFIFEALGLTRPEAQAVETSSGYVTFTSQEKLEMIDGDIIFVLSHKQDQQEFFKDVAQSPLGKRLRGVQQNQVYYVDGLTWNGGNLLAADAVIDDLYKYLVNQP